MQSSPAITLRYNMMIFGLAHHEGLTPIYDLSFYWK